MKPTVLFNSLIIVVFNFSWAHAGVFSEDEESALREEWSSFNDIAHTQEDRNKKLCS